MKRIAIITGLFIILINFGYSQEFVIYNQYINNPFLYNPAWAGSTKYNELNLSHRNQWVGVKDAPRTQTLSYQMLLGKKVGLGAYYYRDQNGRTSRSGCEAAFSYHVRFASYKAVQKKNTLAFALSLGANRYKMNLTDLLSENVDPALADGKLTVLNPTVSFGALYQWGNYSAGFSTKQVLPESVKLSTAVGEPTKPRNYYLYNSYKFEFAKEYELIPSLLIKYNDNNEKQFDINAKGIYKGFFNTEVWFAITYRRTMDESSGKSNVFAPSLGIHYQQFTLAYLYEKGLTGWSTYNKGSHEIMVGYSFNRTTKTKTADPAYRQGIKK